MEKHFKHKSSSISSRNESDSDVVALINEMQQQLVFLEKKIDILISQSSQRPFEAKHFSKPLRSFDHSSRYGKGKQGNSFGERNFAKAICAECKKECEVPFNPSGDRPVYCRECFPRRGGPVKGKRDENRSKEGNSVKGRYFDKPYADGKRRASQKKKQFPRRIKGRA